MGGIIEKSLIKINKEPVVIFPLRKWEEIKETLEDLEDAVRFNTAYQETRGQKGIALKELKRKYKLK
jgi:hypothetical protein